MSNDDQLPPGVPAKQSKASQHIPLIPTTPSRYIPEQGKLYDQEKSIYIKFIEALEKSDPTGLSKAYYTTLVGKYEKTVASEGNYEADKKALDYIKNNDPTGFIKWYYEETRLGKIEIDLVKTIDNKANKLDQIFDGGIKAILKDAKQVLHDVQGIVSPSKDNSHNNKNLLGKPKSPFQID